MINIVLAVLSLILAVMLLYKAYTVRDISVVGSAIPRIVLAAVMLFPKLFNGFNNLILIIILVFISDIIVNTLRWIASSNNKYTLQRNAIKTLISIESRYKALVDNSLVGIYVIDCKGRILYMNDKALELLGISEKDSHYVMLPKLIFDEDKFLSLIRDCSSKTIDEILLNTTSKISNKNLLIFGKTSINGMTTVTGIIIDPSKCCVERENGVE